MVSGLAVRHWPRLLPSAIIATRPVSYVVSAGDFTQNLAFVW